MTAENAESTENAESEEITEKAESEEITKIPVRKAAWALLAATLAAGAAYTVTTATRADRPAPDPTEPTASATAAKDLRSLLLPYGTNGYSRGPDIDEFGSDTVVGGREATALRKEALSGLPRTARRELGKRIDAQRAESVAMRSYVSADLAGDTTLHADKVFTIGVELTRMDSDTAVRRAATENAAFLKSMKIFREGPRIEGHDNATCFQPPEDKERKLDTMICSAYAGDILIDATAYGIKPLNADGIARFLRAQLDRVGEPGASV